MSKTTRVRGFAPWSPQKKTLALMAQVNEVLDEYRDHLPMTIRQIFYRLVGKYGYAKTENAYEGLCEKLNRARRSGLICFSAIRDDGTSLYKPRSWSGIREVMSSVAAIADSYTLDRQRGQPVRLWVMCEAQGMAPMLARVAETYGISVMSSGGFDSLTAKHKFADKLSYYGKTEILHIGDRDPSGVHLFMALADDIQQLCIGLKALSPTFTRLAVTPAQIRDMELPTAPAKTTDKRAFEGETVQAEAIPPDRICAILLDAITSRQDEAARADLLAREAQDRDKLRDMIGGIV